MKKTLLTFTLSLLALGAFSNPIKVLIVTGQNNHNWKSSSVILSDVLKSSGVFEVNTSISPEQGADMSDFCPSFANYDVVLIDYNGDMWPEKTRQSFTQYVRNGGGVVIYHAADNAFRNWKEYNLMAGVGGWEGRDETDGPHVYWENGKIVKDTSPGPGGSHGQQHQFKIVKRAKHPITNGLPNEWVQGKDELYDRLRGPAENMTVLATAFSDKDTGGTNRHEPVLMTIKFGKGRVFHTVLGHVGNEAEHPAVSCQSFKVTLLRGTEWAATGRVKQKVPADFTKK